MSPSGVRKKFSRRPQAVKKCKGKFNVKRRECLLQNGNKSGQSRTIFFVLIPVKSPWLHVYALK